MPIPGIISFLLIGRPKQEIEPGTIMFRIRYLMEGCIDHEPTSLLKEYHIHLNAQPKEGQENPFVTQNHINIKEINYHHNQIIIIILSYEKIYTTTNKHNLNQSSSYFKDNKRIPYTHHRIRII